MRKVAIVTDSTCDLPNELVEEFGIHVLPLQIIYKDRQYRDNVDITAEDVYSRLKEEVPTTSLPRPIDVESLFDQLIKDGFSDVVSIHLSSKLSGTSQMMSQMAERVKDLMVHVVDSKSISMGLGYTVLEAAQKLKETADVETVLSHVHNVIERLKVFFVLDTLEYLIKGGRIGKVAGTIGQILNVKPIIMVNEEGVYTTYCKVRGRKKSIEKIGEIAKSQLQKAISNVAICHGGALEEAKSLLGSLSGIKTIKKMIACQVSPVIGVHTGPGTIGVAVYALEES